MIYYSYLIDKYNNTNKRPTVEEYRDLYNYLPVYPRDIWCNDRYHGADINEYLVPTEFDIILYANRSFGDDSIADEINFDCGNIIGNNIDATFFDEIVEALRTFETRRNLYLMNEHAKGKTPMEYEHTSKLNDFDITDSSRMVMFNTVGEKMTEAKPNYRVSESFLMEFYGHDYEYYANEKTNRRNQVLNNFDILANVSSKEEWNIKIINWINRNIFDLANIGFYASNFPDVIFFGSNFSNSKVFPVGTVHRPSSSINPVEKISGISNIFKKFKKF